MPRRLACLLLVAACHAASPSFAGEKKKGGGPTFIQLKPMAAIAFRPDGRRGVLTVEAGLDVKDQALHARAESMIPRLRDAYAAEAQNYARSLPAGAPVDADRLSAILQRETDRVLGKPGAKVLLGTILMN